MTNPLKVLVIGASQLYSTKDYLEREEKTIKNIYKDSTSTTVITKIATTYNKDKVFVLNNIFRPNIISIKVPKGLFFNQFYNTFYQ